MIKIKLAVAKGPDILLGRVDENGTIYQVQTGIDNQVGRVNLSSGKIYEDRLGPDKKVGRVNLKNGKVYSKRLGPDKYLGKVDGNGSMHRYVHMGTDSYIGKADPFVSFAHSGGAMLLLVMLALEEHSIN